MPNLFSLSPKIFSKFCAAFLSVYGTFSKNLELKTSP